MAVPAPPTPLARTEFLRQHCFRCHGSAETALELGAGVRLDDLGPDLHTDITTTERWQKVLNALNSGDMPPEGEPAIGSDLKAAFLASLSVSLSDARKAFGDQGRTAALRRLNRREYAHTLRSLIGADIDVSALPADDAGGSFDTIGSALFMSSDQFEQYLAVGRKAAVRAIADWRQSAGTPHPVRTVRTEVEHQARQRAAQRLSGQLRVFRRAKEWQAAGSEPAKTKDFGFSDAQAAHFEIQNYERYAPFFGQYLVMPGADDGAWLASFQLDFDSVSVSFPGYAPPGRYFVRIRAAASETAPSGRRFLEMVVPAPASEPGSDRVLDVFHVWGSVKQPQTIDIPVDLTADGPRTFAFREKRFADSASERLKDHLAFAINGIGYDMTLWIDWVEWEGPVPDPARVARLRRLFGAAFAANEDPARTKGVIENMARQAFRGVEPEPEYVDRLMAIHQSECAAGKPWSEALVEPLAVILASPAFLYLYDPAGGGAAPQAAADDADRTLSGLELASRLSYFLWAEPPDDELIAAAVSGNLREPQALAGHVRRMIADPRSLHFAQGFTHQWLHVDRLEFFRFNHQLYPDFDESTRAAARGEIYHTFHTLLQDNLDARSLLASDFVVVNGLLAAYYGLVDRSDPAKPVPITGPEYRRVALPPGSERGGLLGMTAVLAMGSNGEQTSPVERGAWVLRKLLNDPPPPAPPNVPQLSRLEGQQITTRERLRLHQEQPQCAHCHRLFDPIGFGLENFDAVGRWRREEHVYKTGLLTKSGFQGKVIAETFPIDPSGAFHNGPAFKDFFELRAMIAARGDDFLRGLIENLYSYALGRPVSFADADTIDAVVTQAKAEGGGLASIIQSIVATPEFRTK
jgi:hypothetical protein